MASTRRAIFSALLCFATASCGGGGGGGGGGGPTILTGTLQQPLSGQCSGCSVSDAPVTFFVLTQDTPPEPIDSAMGDSQGRYTSASLTDKLGGSRAIIAVASIGSAAFLGGAEFVNAGSTNAKDLTVTTQVACQAVLDIVSGTKIATGNANDGCEVAKDGKCETSQPCYFTLFEGFFDRDRIAILEQAASRIQSRVNLQGNVGRAACAVINCTFEGAGPASVECLNGFFP